MTQFPDFSSSLISMVMGGDNFFIAPTQPASKQIYFPRSKKKRIQNKWRKDSKNWDYHYFPIYTLRHSINTFKIPSR